MTEYVTVILARACEQFTGAEIEAVFIDTMHEAYAKGKEPGPKEILEAMPRTVPLANLMDDQICGLRHWAKGRARSLPARFDDSPVLLRIEMLIGRFYHHASANRQHDAPWGRDESNG